MNYNVGPRLSSKPVGEWVLHYAFNMRVWFIYIAKGYFPVNKKSCTKIKAQETFSSAKYFEYLGIIPP